MPVTYCRAGETTGPITLTSTPGDFTADTRVEVEGGDCAVAVTFVSATTVTFTVTPQEDVATGDREIRIFELGKNATPVVKTEVVSILRRGCLGSRIYCFTEVQPAGDQRPDNCDDAVLPSHLQSVYDTASVAALAPRIYLWDKADGDVLPLWDPADGATGPDLHSSAGTKEAPFITGYLYGPQATWLSNLLHYDVARGVFPDEYVDSTGVPIAGKKWLGFPDPTVNCRLLDHPGESFFRRPFYYMATPDYFWSKNSLVDASRNRSWAQQMRFGGLPMYYRGKNTQTFNENYTRPFNILSGYHKLYIETPPKASLIVSIELLELVAPGPRLSKDIANASDEKQEYTYRRWPAGSSAKAKIRVYSQDMWAFQDFAAPGVGVHEIGEPICIAEAFCPRIDLTYDYNEWDSIGQAPPRSGSNNGLKPSVTGESTSFEWKETISSESLVTINDSDYVGSVGSYLTPAIVYDAAKSFLAEFDGYKCKLVFKGPLAWERSTLQPDNSFTARSQVAPTYANPPLDREGTWVTPTEMYLEVVE